MKRTKNKHRLYAILIALALLIYFIAYIAIGFRIVYPIIAGEGTAEYQTTESTIEIDFGEWKFAVVKGYIDESGERTEFEFETSSELISKAQILKEEGASKEAEVVVESVQTYRLGKYQRARLDGDVIGSSLIPIIVCYSIYQKISDYRYLKKLNEK